MTEELIGALSKISKIRVISRTSVMQYKGTHKKPLPQIAKELGVDTVLEGSVARNEKTHRVRISAQLIDAATDRNVWSESYERDVGDVFAIQGEVARNVAREIQAQLTPEEQQRLASAGPVNAAAHEAYLMGRYHWQRGTEQQFREAKRFFEQAIAIDPKYAPAYAGLADYYFATDDLAPQVAMPKAKELVMRALTIDETLAEAHTTLGSIKFYGDWDWSAAEVEFMRAVALNPSNAEAHRMYSVYLSQMGRHGAAEEQIQFAVKLDPISFSTSVTVGWVYYYGRKYDRAIEHCEKSLKLDPDAISAHECLSAAYLGKRAYRRAIAEARVISTRTSGDPVRLAALGRAYAMAGEKGEAEAILRRLSSTSQDHYVPPYFFAIVCAALGDREQSIHWLERAYSAHDTYLVRLKVDDAMDPVRSDPRFGKLLLQIGLSP
jgi:TolB-like protein/tetratricopeptide (TPR) repeat protein